MTASTAADDQDHGWQPALLDPLKAEALGLRERAALLRSSPPPMPPPPANFSSPGHLEIWQQAWRSEYLMAAQLLDNAAFQIEKSLDWDGAVHETRRHWRR